MWRSFGGTLASSLAELERSLVGLWAINRHRDSVELLKDFMDAMPSCGVHILRNLYVVDESKLELYAASKALRARVESAAGKSLNFPDLASVADDRRGLGHHDRVDYHLQLYAAFPDKIAEEPRLVAAELGRIVEGAERTERSGCGKVVASVGAPPKLSARGPAAGGGLVAFGGLCIAAGYLMAERGRPPWGRMGPLGAALGAPAGWLVLSCSAPLLATSRSLLKMSSGRVIATLG